MYKFRTFLTLLVVLFLFSGCANDDSLSQSRAPLDGKTRIILSLGDRTLVETRTNTTVATDNERTIDTSKVIGKSATHYDLYLLIFDSSNKYKDGELVEKVNLAGKDGDQVRILTTSLIIESTDQIVILGNTGSTAVGVPLSKGNSLATINRQFPQLTFSSSDLAFNQSEDNSGKGMPISGRVVRGTDLTVQCDLRRSVAKIQLSVSGSMGGAYAANIDQSTEWTLANTPVSGYIYSDNGAMTVPDIMSFNYKVLKWPSWRIPIGNSPKDLSKETLYIPEYRFSTLGGNVSINEFFSNRVCIIAKATNGRYYRIDFYNQTDKQYLDIKRNHHYIVNVKKVNSDGYATYDEAILNLPSNIEYEIIVDGDNENVIASNGQYGLSLSDTLVYVYGDPGIYDCFDARYIVSAEDGSITIPTPNSIEMENGTDASLVTTSLTNTMSSVKINFTGTAQSTANLKITLANIQRNVEVVRLPTETEKVYPPTTYSYVGAFWRNIETGERLIRLQVKSGMEGKWRAAVVWHDAQWSNDDIMLDVTDLPTYPAVDNGAGANAELRQLSTINTKKIVEGKAAIDEYIYFRIGLKSKYVPTAAHPARYALVYLSYANNTIGYYLYLRQGENDDYLMGTGAGYPKFSPYNLTIPAGSTFTSGWCDVPYQGGGFVNYPTMSGAFWQYIGQPSRRAYSPATTGLTGFGTDTVTDFTDTADETCPDGYRRPETRVELTNNLVYDNSMWGYYADGYFDRYEITNSRLNAISSAVNRLEGVGTGYVGRLYFNRSTKASLFMPASGYRYWSSGSWGQYGSQGFYTTREFRSSYNYGYLIITNSTTNAAQSHSALAINVRCVKD